MDWTSEDQVSLTGLKKEQIDFMRATVKEYAMKGMSTLSEVVYTCLVTDFVHSSTFPIYTGEQHVRG